MVQCPLSRQMRGINWYIAILFIGLLGALNGAFLVRPVAGAMLVQLGTALSAIILYGLGIVLALVELWLILALFVLAKNSSTT